MAANRTLPKIESTTFEKGLTQVARKLFRFGPVYKRPDYFNSYSMQSRKKLLPDSDESTMGTGGKPGLDELPEYFGESFYLGPYEKRILNDIIETEDVFIPFRGGSRSGKTSTLRFIYRYCNDHRNIGTKNDLSFLYIDTGSYIPELRERHESKEDISKEDIGIFFTIVARAINADFKELMGSRYFDILYDSYNKIEGFFEITDFSVTAVRRISGFTEWDSWNEVTQNGKNELLDSMVRKLESGREKIIAALHPISYFNKLNKDNDNGEIVVIIDNVDSLPTTYQEELLNQFRTITESKCWFETKVIIAIRLSTFRRHIGQLTDPITHDHECVDPTEVALDIINLFLLDPFRIKAFCKLSTDYKNAVLLRFFALWSHMVDHAGYFRPMLGALAGTNIKNAKKIISNWITSTHFPYGDYNVDVFNEHKEDFLEILSEAVLRELWDSTLRALKWSVNAYANKHNQQIGGDQGRLKDFYYGVGNKAGVKYSTIVAEICADNKITCYPKYKDKLGVRRIVSKKIKTKGSEILKRQLEEEQTRDKISKVHAIQIIKILRDNIEFEFLGSFIDGFKEKVNKVSLIDAFEAACCDFEGGYDKHLTKKLIGWIEIVLAQVQTIYPDISSNNDKSDPVIGDISPYSRFIKKYAPSISRFEAGWQLLEPKGIKTEDKVKAINVFFTGDAIKPLPLFILYKLYYSNTEFEDDVAAIKNLASFYGYTVDELTDTLTPLVHIDKRLIFSSVSDYYLGVEKLYNDPSLPIVLSAAGKGYVQELITTPPYLQWCFSKINKLEEIRNKDLLSQINIVHDNLVDIVTFEIDRLNEKYNEYEKAGKDPREEIKKNGPNYYCASADVYFRAISNYIPGLIAHFWNKKKGRDKILEGLNNWTEKGQDLLKDIADIYEFSIKDSYSLPKILVDWQISLTHAVNDIEELPKLN